MSFCANASFLRLAICTGEDCISEIKEAGTLKMFFTNKAPSQWIQKSREKDGILFVFNRNSNPMMEISNEPSVFFNPEIPKPEDLGPVKQTSMKENLPQDLGKPSLTTEQLAASQLKKNQLKWHLTVLLKFCKRDNFRSLFRELNPKASVIHLVDSLKHVTDLDIAAASITCDHGWGRDATLSDGQRTQVIYQLIIAEWRDWAEQAHPSNAVFNRMVGEMALDVERQTKLIIDR